MRLSALLAGAVIVCLLLTGLGADSLPFIPKAGFSDAAISHYPAALRIYQGDLFTSWQELNMAGQPFAANPLNKTAYPFQAAAVVLPPALHLMIMFALHVGIAGTGMYRLARRLDLSPEAAAVSALGYAISPRLIGHTGAGHLDIVYALAWFPWLVWAVHRVIHKENRPIPHMLQLALITALIILADLRLSLFALGTAAAYAIWQLGQTRWRRLPHLSRAALLMVPLTLGLTVPLALWQPYLSRTALTAAEAGAFSLEPVQLLGVLIPPPAADIEMQTHLGLVVTIVALCAIAARPRRHLFWIIVSVTALLYALGSNGPLWTVLVELIPPLRLFRVPARAWLVIALTAPLLAGWGVQTLMNIRDGAYRKHARRLRLVGLVSLLITVVTGGFVLAAVPDLATAGLRLLLIGGISSALVIAATSGWLTPSRMALAFFAVLFIDLSWNARDWLEWRSPEAWSAPYAETVALLNAERPDRIYSPTYSLPQQVAADQGLHLFGGVDPFQLRGIAEAIETASGVGHHGYTVVQPPLIGGTGDDLSGANRDAAPDTERLAEWQVSHIVSAYALTHPRLELVGQPDDIYVYRNLDYRLTLARDLIPRWPETENLPDPTAVASLNNLTGIFQRIGLLLMSVVFVIMVWLELKRR